MMSNSLTTVDTALKFEKVKIELNFQKSQDKAIKKPRKGKNRLKKSTAWEKSQGSVSLRVLQKERDIEMNVSRTVHLHIVTSLHLYIKRRGTASICITSLDRYSIINSEL